MPIENVQEERTVLGDRKNAPSRSTSEKLQLFFQCFFSLFRGVTVRRRDEKKINGFNGAFREVRESARRSRRSLSR